MMQRVLVVFAVLLLAPLALAAEPVPFRILHTNDLHSQMEGGGPDRYFTAATGDQDPVKGHYARLAHLIRKLRSEAAASKTPVLTFDAGDFFSGTLFHVLGPSRATPLVPELQFFADLGYDAVSLGNHEFDPGEEGLAVMLDKVERASLVVPLVASNAQFKDRSSVLAPFFGEGRLVAPYRITEISSGGQRLKIGIIGLVGPDAALVSAANRKTIEFAGFDETKTKMRMSDLIGATKARVAELRESKKVDVVVVVMHGGSPEDRELAEGVPGIDVLIAGHTHESYDTVVGSTVIAQTGCYGQNLGVLDLEYANGRVRLAKARRIAIDDTVPADADYVAKIESYKKAVKDVLGPTGRAYDEPIFTVSRDVPRERTPNAPLGRLVATGLLTELNKHLASPADLYFTSQSLVRAPLATVAGKPALYQYSDVFRILSVGFARDLSPGYPVVTFYLTPDEVQAVADFTEIYSHLSANFAAAFSDTLSFRIRPWGVPFFGRVTDVKLHGIQLADHKGLVKVATNEFVSRYFKKLPALSYGLIDVRPKDEAGRELTEIPVDLALPREFELLATYFKGTGVRASK